VATERIAVHPSNIHIVINNHNGACGCDPLVGIIDLSCISHYEVNVAMPDNGPPTYTDRINVDGH
jgi:hypothetical protein